MSKTIHAVFENGVFRPVESVDLPEKAKVEFEPRLVAKNEGWPAGYFQQTAGAFAGEITPDSLILKADLAFEDACRKVIDRARASKTEIVIWRDGKMVELSPEEAITELESNLAKLEAKNLAR